MSNVSNKNTISDYLDVYLENKNKRDELEVRFATKHYNPLTKIKFDKTIEKLRNSGFDIKAPMSENMHFVVCAYKIG